MNSFSFLCRTKLCFGFKALENLPFDLAGMGCKKPLIIQDKAACNSGAVKAVSKAFKDSEMALGVSPGIPLEPDDVFQVQFIKFACNAYFDNGHDALIALGGADAAQITKGVNMAVTFGPECLASDQVQGRLSPFIFIPRTSAGGLACCGEMQFRTTVFQSDFLAPDQVVMAPELLILEDLESLIDTALFCLALGSEILALSKNPAACAYARLVVTFSNNVLTDILDHGRNCCNCLEKNKNQHLDLQKELIQAAVMAGCLGRLPSTLTRVGKILEIMSDLCLGQAMCLVLPGFLETAAPLAPGFCKAIDADGLLLALSGPLACSQVPEPQRLSAAIQAIRSTINSLHAFTLGKRPRTLAEAGMDHDQLTAAAGQLAGSGILAGLDPARFQTLLTTALTGEPVPGI